MYYDYFNNSNFEIEIEILNSININNNNGISIVIDNTDSKHTVKLYKSNVIKTGTMCIQTWIEDIISTINTIDKTKEFRQNDIIKQWSNISNMDCLEEINNKIQYIDLELTVSSGFFIRQYIRDLMEHSNIPLLCYDIHRISID